MIGRTVIEAYSDAHDQAESDAWWQVMQWTGPHAIVTLAIIESVVGLLTS